MSEHDELRDWDAAYLLGSLSTDERRRFERHLADCAACAASVAELAGLPGLLGKVPVAEAEASLESVPAAPDLFPRLVDHVAGRRRLRRRWVVAVSVAGAAAALVLGALVVPGLVASVSGPDVVAVQLQPVTASPLEASIRLIEEQWGTRVEMECRYGAVEGYSAPSDYAMYVVDTEGDGVRIATWTAAPGRTATPSGTTSLAISQIQAVELRSVADGAVLLRGTW